MFAAKFGLDAASVATLTALQPESQAKLMASFAPKPNTRDVNALFRGHAKSFVSDDKCLGYCLEKGLDQTCLDTLIALGAEQRERVMADFCPRAGTRSPVGLFLSFCRSVTGVAGAKGKGKDTGGGGK